MAALTTDQRLDVVLAALYGADLKPKFIRLSTRDRRKLAAPGALTHRGLAIHDGEASHVVVDLPGLPDARAPIQARAFFHWFPRPHDAWPQGVAKRTRRAA